VIWVNLPVKFRQSNNKNTGAWIIHAPFFMLFMMHRYTTILLFTLFSCGMLAQQDSLIMSVPDTLKTSQDSIFVPDTSQFKTDFRKKFSLRWHMHPHSPLRATVYSAAFPGLGQIYNGNKKEGSCFRKYWKVPIVYGGVATCVAFIDFNTKKYRYYKSQYIALNDGDDSTIPDQDYNSSWLDDVQEQYHRWMDVSYMCLAGLYVLQIIDANVDAHLFYYDVGNDLSLNIQPSLIFTGEINPAIGIGIRF
jgi:hypothetical protein